MIKTLVELLQGTCFFVNDYEVTAEGGTAFNDLTEVEASFAVKAVQTIPAGTIISLQWGGSSVSTTTYDWTIPTGAGFGNNNEEIYIYAAPDIAAKNPTAFIYSVSIGSSSSARSNGLVTGTTLIEPTGTSNRYKTIGVVDAGCRVNCDPRLVIRRPIGKELRQVLRSIRRSKLVRRSLEP